MKSTRRLARFGWLLLAFLPLAAGCEPAATPRGKVDRQPRQTGMALEAFFAPLSLDQALAQAKSDGKLVMVDFYTEWCGWCKVLDKNTWTDAEVQSWLKEKSVPIKLDAEKDEAAARKYSVTSFPQVLFIKPDGTEVGRIVGYKNPEQFLNVAEGLVAGK
jgi:thiol:disulfide interchange protein